MTRWRRLNPRCVRQTFADSLPEVALLLGRRTRRVAELARLVGHTSGGRPAERLLNRLGLPQNNGTVLRNLKHHARGNSGKGIRVVGVDDWAWQKGGRYGTIMVGLERRKVVDVVSGRSVQVTGEWLVQHLGNAFRLDGAHALPLVGSTFIRASTHTTSGSVAFGLPLTNEAVSSMTRWDPGWRVRLSRGA